jgi:hypothetical protein
MEAIEVVREMAGIFPDCQIAATLNRLGLKTGAGNTWREGRIRSLRSHIGLPSYDPARLDERCVTLEQPAERLGVAIKTMKRLIQDADSGAIGPLIPVGNGPRFRWDLVQHSGGK